MLRSGLSCLVLPTPPPPPSLARSALGIRSRPWRRGNVSSSLASQAPGKWSPGSLQAQTPADGRLWNETEGFRELIGQAIEMGEEGGGKRIKFGRRGCSISETVTMMMMMWSQDIQDIDQGSRPVLSPCRGASDWVFVSEEDCYPLIGCLVWLSLGGVYSRQIFFSFPSWARAAERVRPGDRHGPRR